MPTEYIDTIVESLKHEPASTPCIFNCQMGKGRTTLGMVAACLVKEITITAELRYSLFINGALGHFISIIIVGHWPQKRFIFIIFLLLLGNTLHDPC